MAVEHDPTLSRLMAAFMIAAAVAVFSLMYLPARTRRAQMHQKLTTSRTRIARLQERVRRLELRRDALAAGEPMTLEEAAREYLGQGAPHALTPSSPVEIR